MLLDITVTLSIPELLQVGEQLMAGLQEIRAAIGEQGEAIAAEIDQLAAKLASQDVIDPAEVTALADLVRTNTAQIRGMIADEPTGPATPAPGA